MFNPCNGYAGKARICHIAHDQCRKQTLNVSEQPLLTGRGISHISILESGRHFLNNVKLELIANLDIVEFVYAHAAFVTRFNLFHVILEATQR